MQVNVNGLQMEWSLALRFWCDENGHRLTNPVVICLNLLSSSAELGSLASEIVQVTYNYIINYLAFTSAQP